MTISFACPHCGRKFNIPDHLVGRRARCQGCDRTISIPRKSAAAVAKPTPVRPARAENRSAPTAPAPMTMSGDLLDELMRDDATESDQEGILAPSGRNIRQQKSLLIWLIAAACLVPVVLVASLAITGMPSRRDRTWGETRLPDAPFDTRPPTGFSDKYDWQEYTSPDGTFRITLPGEPEIGEDESGLLLSVQLPGDIGCMVHSIDVFALQLKAHSDDTEVCFDHLHTTTRPDFPHRVLDVRPISRNGHPGREYTTRTQPRGGQPVFAHIQYCMTDDSVFVVEWLSRDGAEMSDDAVAFFQSIRFGKDGAKVTPRPDATHATEGGRKGTAEAEAVARQQIQLTEEMLDLLESIQDIESARVEGHKFSLLLKRSQELAQEMKQKTSSLAPADDEYLRKKYEPRMIALGAASDRQVKRLMRMPRVWNTFVVQGDGLWLTLARDTTMSHDKSAFPRGIGDEIAAAHGANRLAKIMVPNPGSEVDSIADALARIDGISSCESREMSGQAFFVCGPVADLLAFVPEIDFGVVMEIDRDRRIIGVIVVAEGLLQ